MNVIADKSSEQPAATRRILQRHRRNAAGYFASLPNRDLVVEVVHRNVLVSLRRASTQVSDAVLQFVAERFAGEGIKRQRHINIVELRGQLPVVRSRIQT